MPTPATFALPLPKTPLTPFRRSILSMGPSYFYLCDEAVGATRLVDVVRRLDLTTITGSPGSYPIQRGELASFATVNGAGAISASNPTVPALFTIGCVVDIETNSTDTSLFGCWNGTGIMLANVGTALRVYMGGTNCSETVTTVGLKAQFLVGTYDGTNLNLYRNGALVAGPTAATFSGASQSLGINFYSGQYRDGYIRISDCFILPFTMSAGAVSQLNRLR